MNNFLEFIQKDIEAKKKMLSTLPIKTKTDKKKYNEEVDKIIAKYDSYYNSVKRYIYAKADSMEVPAKFTRVEEIKQRIDALNEIKRLLSPMNTPYEKLGFDTLVYELDSYYTFNFKNVDAIINKMLDIFTEAGIVLTGRDFYLTPYVKSYMTEYLKVYYSKSDDRSALNKVFEDIYYANPDLIYHIEICLELLFLKNNKKMNRLVKIKTESLKTVTGVRSYKDAVDKLTFEYADLHREEREQLSDIIKGAKDGTFDVNSYQEDNKTRTGTYESLFGTEFDFNDRAKMDKYVELFESFVVNIEEYDKFLQLAPIFEYIKNDLKKLMDVKQADADKKFKEEQKRVEKLDKTILKKCIKYYGIGPFRPRMSADKQEVLRREFVSLSNDIYKGMPQYNDALLEMSINDIINANTTAYDALLYFSMHDLLLKKIIQKVYNLQSYAEIVEKANQIKEYIYDESNVILTGIRIFQDNDIPRMLSSKFKLNGVTVEEAEFSGGDLGALTNKLLLVIRCEKVKRSPRNMAELLFMKNVSKIREKEPKPEPVAENKEGNDEGAQAAPTEENKEQKEEEQK